MTESLQILQGDCRRTLGTLPEGSVQCCVTSPPYWGLRSYLANGHPDKALEIGSEETPALYVETMRQVFGGRTNPVGVWRALKEDGVLWLNLGDSYAASAQGSGTVKLFDKQSSNRGSLDLSIRKKSRTAPQGLKPKDLVGIPWLVAFALREMGWYLRSDIIWAKPNCMPESVTDRPTRSHEYLFLLTKSERYFYDHEAIKERCIYDVDGRGTAARKARAEGNKLLPTATVNGIRPAKSRNGGYKNSVNFDGKNKGNKKQRGHGRRHNGFNDRWDLMSHEEQCTGMRNKRDVWRTEADQVVTRWLVENQPEVWKQFMSESRNRKSVLNISPANYPEAHFATFPPELITPCILAGSRPGDTILDPFGGSGTGAQVAVELGRRAIMLELNPEYVPMMERRIRNTTPALPLKTI